MAVLTLRLVKGSPLTNQEVDDNFSALNTAKYESGDSAVFSDVQLSGGVGTAGTLSWNADEDTVDLIQNGTVLQLGQEVQYNVRNNTASAIAAGTPVMATGAPGDSGRITVAPMDATDPANARFYMGIATETIAAGEDGKITFFGKVRGVDLSAYSKGDVLWLSTDTVGALTATEPTIGTKIATAFVMSNSATVGTMFVRATNSIRLQDVDDVQIIGVTDGELLVYDSTTGGWVNQTISEAGLATSAQGALADSAVQPGDNVSGLTNDAGYLASVTASDVDSGVATDGHVLTADGAGNAAWEAVASTVGALTDVTITTPADNEVLAYNSGSGEWVNQTASEAGLATAAQGSLADSALQDGDTVSSLTITSADINGGTLDGVVIGGASAAAATFTDLTASGTVDLPDGSLTISDTSGLQGALDDKAPLASPTFTGTATIPTADINGGNIDDTVIGGTTPAGITGTTIEATGAATFGAEIVETAYTLSGTTPALDPANGTIQYWTLTANSSPTDSLSSGESMTLIINTSTGYTVTWPSIVWDNGLPAPTLDPSTEFRVVLYKVGVSLRGSY